MESIKVHKLNSFLTQEIKLIAEAVIHFEPALDRIIEELGPGQSKARNWRDNPHLGGANKSRSESIAAVQAVLPSYEGREHDELTDFLMGRPGINFYRWNFKHISRYAMIQFTPGPECRTIGDALWWADFALTFIEAAIDYWKSPGQLQKYSPNYQGLRELLSGVREPPGSEALVWRPVRRVGVQALPTVLPHRIS